MMHSHIIHLFNIRLHIHSRFGGLGVAFFIWIKDIVMEITGLFLTLIVISSCAYKLYCHNEEGKER